MVLTERASGLVQAIRRASAPPTDVQRFRGRFQWWKAPVYVSPHTHPLHEGPDFSFLDGRKPQITQWPQKVRRDDQIRLSQKVVELLGEVNEARALHLAQQKQEAEFQESIQKWTPSAKGNVELY